MLSRDDDHTAASVVAAVGQAQSAVPVAHWGLGRLLDVATQHGELVDWADTVRARSIPDEQVV